MERSDEKGKEGKGREGRGVIKRNYEMCVLRIINSNSNSAFLTCCCC
jgi:hypothetical protein